MSDKLGVEDVERGRGGVSPTDNKGEIYCLQGERSHFEGTYATRINL